MRTGNVFSVSFERAAAPAVIANDGVPSVLVDTHRRQTRNQVGLIAMRCEAPWSPSPAGAPLRRQFGGFPPLEADQPDVRLLVMDADRVTADDALRRVSLGQTKRHHRQQGNNATAILLITGDPVSLPP
jgi:hypothetical protein